MTLLPTIGNDGEVRGPYPQRADAGKPYLPRREKLPGLSRSHNFEAWGGTPPFEWEITTGSAITSQSGTRQTFVTGEVTVVIL